MIDISTEATLPLAAAARLIPSARGSKKCHLSTLLRWIMSGAKSPTGERVRLEALRLGGRWLTSREAIQRFAERLTPPIGEARPAESPPTPNQRRRAAQRADAQLKAMGV